MGFVRQNGVRLCMVGVFITLLGACVRYVEVKEDWKWGQEVFLPSVEGLISVSGKATSMDSLYCEEKAKILAMDKLQHLVGKTLEAFIMEARHDSINKSMVPRLEKVLYQSEYLSMEGTKVINLRNLPGNGQYICDIKVGLPLYEVLDKLRMVTLNQPELWIQLQNFEVYSRINNEASKFAKPQQTQ